jgi:hypothetical protein
MLLWPLLTPCWVTQVDLPFRLFCALPIFSFCVPLRYCQLSEAINTATGTSAPVRVWLSHIVSCGCAAW